jgi:hypothetical protein
MIKTLKTLLLSTIVALGACGGGSGAPKQITNADEYKAAMNYFMDKAVDIMKGDDCGKMATDLKALADNNKDLMKQGEEWKKAHADEDKKIEEEMMKGMMDKMGPVMSTMMKCDKDPAFKEAMKSMKQ